MKKFLAFVLIVLSTVVFSSCTYVNNNYYEKNDSALSSETEEVTQPVKDDIEESSTPVADTTQSTSNEKSSEYNNDTPFYGIWVYASKSCDEASSFADEVSSNGFNGYTEVTTDWSNLNKEKWYVVTAGKYSSENEAKTQLNEVKKKYPDAYVKYSGDYINN